MSLNIAGFVKNTYGMLAEAYAPIDRRKKLGKRDNELMSLHPEWTCLTAEEKKLAFFKEDYSQLTAFKNVCCDGNSLKKGYVSDIAYQNRILPKLHKMDYMLGNPLTAFNIFNDKNYFEIFMPEISFPETVIRNVDGEYLTKDYRVCDNPIEVMNNFDELVFKGTLIHGHTTGVKLVKKANYEKELCSYKEDFIVQVPLIQDPFLAKWNSSSVNIIRITTLYWKGRIYVLGGILRVGPPGEFCDLAVSGEGVHPRIVGIEKDGTLMNRVVDPDTATVYPDIWGKKPEGKIERYSEMVEIAVKAHERFPHHKIIGWDFTVDNMGNIVCMEYNITIPGIIQSQYVLGPVFYDTKTPKGTPLLDELLTDISQKS